MAAAAILTDPDLQSMGTVYGQCGGLQCMPAPAPVLVAQASSLVGMVEGTGCCSRW